MRQFSAHAVELSFSSPEEHAAHADKESSYFLVRVYTIAEIRIDLRDKTEAGNLLQHDVDANGAQFYTE